MTKRLPLTSLTPVLHLLRQGWTILSPEQYEIHGDPETRDLRLRAAAGHDDGTWPLTSEGCAAALRDAESHDQKVRNTRGETLGDGTSGGDAEDTGIPGVPVL